MAIPLQEHARSAVLRRGIQRCLAAAAPFAGTVCRAVAPKYANDRDLLTGAGAKLHGGRWNPPGLFCAVYGTLDPYAALAESLGNFGHYGIPYAEGLPLTLVGLAVDLQRVLDLSAGATRQRVGVSAERMAAADWQAAQSQGREGLTQALGRLAWEAGVEALLVPSAKLKHARNLVVFPDRLSQASRINIVNLPELLDPR